MMTEAEVLKAMEEVPSEPTDKEVIAELRAEIARLVESRSELTLTRERDFAMERFTEAARLVKKMTTEHAAEREELMAARDRADDVSRSLRGRMRALDTLLASSFAALQAEVADLQRP